MKREDMSATITTAPAVVMEVEIHCAQAYEKKDNSYETVCVSFKE